MFLRLNRSQRFPHVEYHETTMGHEARIRGTRMAVWQFVEMAREFHGDAALMARHLDIDTGLVAEALWYAAEHPDEIRESPLDEDEASTLARLRQMLPDLEVRHSHIDE